MVLARKIFPTISPFLLISLILHILLILAFFVHEQLVEQQKTEEIALDLVPISPDEIKRIRKQIVQTSKVKKSEEAKKDAYLSEQTQVVQVETHSDNTTSFRDAKNDRARGVQVKDLGIAVQFKPLGNTGPPGTSTETSATNDYLKNVQSGSQTLLNTKEFLYFSFYQRVRKQLEQFWEPGLREKVKKMYDRGRVLASEREHATRLLVILNSEGLITRIKMVSTSGLLDLDQVAIDAFNKAGPFPNPPKGMVERDGTVTIEWEFVLKT